jgi:acyl dehydratase
MTVHERPFGRYLEDFVVGDVYKHWPGKTITEYDDHLFCMITMNHHPLHTNDWFAEQSVQGRNVVVGNLVYSLVLGMSVPDVSGAAIANLEVETLQHKFPTFHGDTIHAETGCSRSPSRRARTTAAPCWWRARASTRTARRSATSAAG